MRALTAIPGFSGERQRRQRSAAEEVSPRIGCGPICVGGVEPYCRVDLVAELRLGKPQTMAQGVQDEVSQQAPLRSGAGRSLIRSDVSQDLDYGVFAAFAGDGVSG
jgi:hypothetical protein